LCAQTRTREERSNVSDAATIAKTAREALARGLSALQSDPNVPPALQQLAQPIAQAMGALHQIERSGGTQLVPHADTALNNVRGSLAQLQAQPSSHPIVNAAMEAVASSLSQVHALAKMAQAQPAPQAYAAPPAPAPNPYAQPAAAPQQQYAAPPQQAYAPPPQQPPQQAHVAPQVQPPPMQQQAPQARPAANPYAGAPIASDLPAIAADLGAHSPTNFFKGLSGNDIIDHGGLFVSTYKIPKIGTPVRLKVSLPGGYEFEANAVVRWAREPSDGNDAPPGFGAQFTDITPEARQLVYRYVRNREPLFHDDL
jgi:uncharacterized protein (TIGR02266 family)